MSNRRLVGNRTEKFARWMTFHSTFTPERRSDSSGNPARARARWDASSFAWIEPTSGSVQFEGRDLLSASRGEMRSLRRDLQIIFQDPFASLDPRFRVKDIIAEPLDHPLPRFMWGQPFDNACGQAPGCQVGRSSTFPAQVGELLRAVGSRRISAYAPIRTSFPEDSAPAHRNRLRARAPAKVHSMRRARFGARCKRGRADRKPAAHTAA